MKFALVMTGGIAKGSFQAGAVKAFAEHNLKPSVVVGTSAGALNGSVVTKLLAEDNFTPTEIENTLIKEWMEESKLSVMWGKGDASNKDSIRNIFSDTNSNPLFLLRRLSSLQIDLWQRVRSLLSMSYLSVFNKDALVSTLERNISIPKEIKQDIIFTVALTDLFAHSEYINGQPINNYGEFITFNFKKGEKDNLKERFEKLKKASCASASLPGMFPPSELDIKGKGEKKFYVDGGITKNAPFGRAIKLDPDIQYIFVVSTSPLSKPITNKIDNFPSIVGQIYEIVVTKDIANDYRKVTQINDKIKLLHKILDRDKKGNVLHNENNDNLCKLAGFRGVDDLLSKRCVEIIFIEPETALEGDPFAGIYRKDRKYLMNSYIKHGYEVANKIILEVKDKLIETSDNSTVSLSA